MSPNEEPSAPEETTTLTLSFKSRNAYDLCLPIGDCWFEPGKKYGPFFRADKKNIKWYFDAKLTDANWAGFAEPRARQEAKDWYKTPAKNPLTYIHEFFILVPASEKQKANGSVGKVKDGHGFQINLNHVAVKYIVQHRLKKLPK